MANAYSPGLTVSSNTLVRRTRRLPIKGDVLVSVGDKVTPFTPVARALLPGLMQSVKAANILGIDAAEVEAALTIEIGDPVTRGQSLAQTSSFFGMFKSECKSPVDGTFEIYSRANGSIGIRREPVPVELKAYMSGEIAEILPGEGVVVESEAALIQGIFGVGGERSGILRTVVGSPSELLDADQIDSSLKGSIVVGGAKVTATALAKASAIGLAGIIVGGIVDGVLAEFLGYDIGVAITGDEDLSFTLILTEGFGDIPMAQRTFALLQSLEGKQASINGATQIRAGVIRPEVIVPNGTTKALSAPAAISKLEVGTPIRMIREPYFGVLGTVEALPTNLFTVESGATVRILEARLPGGTVVTVPRANVEVIESS